MPFNGNKAYYCLQPQTGNYMLVTYTSAEVCQILKISKRKLQSLRDNNLIGFLQQGSTIRYTEDHIKMFIRQNNHEPFKHTLAGSMAEKGGENGE